ncbi:uncharacterized protein LOC135937089 [Cloeon dipterum]|uniref:uncharacterized protein LOC135937089 n=1 Tax=Cloeon dipterum TaxID=197152 RepID=UPI003220740C
MRATVLMLLTLSAAALAADDSFVFADSSERYTKAPVIHTRQLQTRTTPRTRKYSNDVDSILMPDQVTKRPTATTARSSVMTSSYHKQRTSTTKVTRVHSSTTPAPLITSVMPEQNTTEEVLVDKRVMANAPNRDCGKGQMRRNGVCRKILH